VAVSQAYIDYVLEQLERCGPVVSKKFFGGAGLYAGGPIFGLIDSEYRFYLKVDETNRADFEACGSTPFNPYGEDSGKKPMAYMTVPEDVLEDPDELAIWASKAIAVAARRKS